MKKVLITGASKGIGFAIALRLLQKGYAVYGLGRSIPEFYSEHFYFLQEDLRDPKAIDRIEELIPEVDILINNAGVGFFRPLENLRGQEIEEMIRVNFIAPILLTRKFLPKLKENKGHVIFIGSESALKGGKTGTVYSATKAGMRGFADALFDECRKSGVKVTSIHPGMVKSTFFDDKDFAPEDDDSCFIEPEDIANIVADALKMRTGSVVREITVFPQKNSLVKNENEDKEDVGQFENEEEGIMGMEDEKPEREIDKMEE